MSGAIAALLLLTVAGLPVAILLDARVRFAELVARSYLLGVFVGGVLLFSSSAVGVPWRREDIVAVAVAALAIAVLVRKRQLPDSRDEQPAHSLLSLSILALAGVIAAGYALYATAGPIAEFDFLSDWGLKGRVFWEAQGIDWTFLESARYRATHADYPILLPLAFDSVALVSGEWNDRSFGVLYVAWACATLLILRRLLLLEGASPTYAALASVAMLPLAASPWIGIAEGPLVAYGTSGLMLLRYGIAHEDARAQRAGALLLGIAALIKNEGVAILVAAALAALLSSRKSRRAAVHFVVPFILAGAWQLVRFAHGLQTDLTSGSALSRIINTVRAPHDLLQALVAYDLGKPLMWFGIVVALVITGKELLVNERFAILTIIFQCGSYLVAYMSTPHDVQWHVRWSLERLVAHVALAITFVILSRLRPYLDRSDHREMNVAAEGTF